MDRFGNKNSYFVIDCLLTVAGCTCSLECWLCDFFPIKGPHITNTVCSQQRTKPKCMITRKKFMGGIMFCHELSSQQHEKPICCI